MPSKVNCKKISAKIGAWANVTKIIMGVCFVLLFILGVALTAVCASVLVKSDILKNFEITGFTALMYFGLILGLFLAIVSLLGVFGFFTLNRPLLIIVTCLILLLAILQIVCFSVAFGYRGKYDDFFSNTWEMADDNSRGYIEMHFGCCGGVNNTDKPGSYCNSTSSSGAYQPPVFSDSSDGGPCVPKLVEFANDQVVSIGVGVLVVTLLEVAVVVVTIVLLVKIGRVQSYYKVQEEDNALDALRH